MNRCRELLKKVLNSVHFSHYHEPLKKDIEDEIAKPDPDPVAYMHNGYSPGAFSVDYMIEWTKDRDAKDNEHASIWSVPLYTSSPPQQKPLSQQAIERQFNLYANQFDVYSNEWQDKGLNEIFMAGFRACENLYLKGKQNVTTR